MHGYCWEHLGQCALCLTPFDWPWGHFPEDWVTFVCMSLCTGWDAHDLPFGVCRHFQVSVFLLILLLSPFLSFRCRQNLLRCVIEREINNLHLHVPFMRGSIHFTALAVYWTWFRFTGRTSIISIIVLVWMWRESLSKTRDVVYCSFVALADFPLWKNLKPN